jgi:hypothetical protein
MNIYRTYILPLMANSVRNCHVFHPAMIAAQPAIHMAHTVSSRLPIDLAMKNSSAHMTAAKTCGAEMAALCRLVSVPA